ncbi:hypothetical protein Tco_0924622 [Tanacetum coccineum]|uniref:Uncharacterized protein n=1 Tax=Tanacetum coccineum TaxID=301880 RepID=A0ABQ5D6K7_9ASTR
MSLDEELAQKLHEEEQAIFNAEQEAKFNAKQEEILASKTTKDEANPPVADIDWDDVQAQIQADEDLAQKLLEEERENLSIKERARLLAELIDKRKKLQAAYSKRQKTGEGAEPTEELKADEISQEDLQQMIMVVSVKEVYVEALQVKYQIIDWERLFEPDTDDILWKLQRYMHDLLTWRLYDTCGVHHVSTDRGHDIFMLVEKDYPLTRGILTLMLCNKLQVDQYSEMANELLKKIFILANKPRQGGSLGIKGFYKFLLLVQLSTAKRRLSTAKLNDKAKLTGIESVDNLEKMIQNVEEVLYKIRFEDVQDVQVLKLKIKLIIQ